MSFNSELAKKLTGCYGPSGREEKIANLVVEEIKDYVDEVNIDTLGNVIARKKGNGKKLMFSAHIDQIGLIVTDIEDKGFIRFTTIGGLNPFNIYGQRVIFENGAEGIIGNEEVGSFADLKMNKLYIDIAALSKEEAESKVEVGDMCVLKSSYYESDNCVMTGALDDRIGTYVLIEALKQQKESNNDCYYVFTTQEEVGLRGAKTSGYTVNPDLFISLDVTETGDTLEGWKMSVKLGNGAAIKLKDECVITHSKVKKLLVNIAKENKIEYQLEVLASGGTDAGAIHTLRDGVSSGGISIPCRWIHGGSEIASKSDISNCIKLVVATAERKLI